MTEQSTPSDLAAWVLDHGVGLSPARQKQLAKGYRRLEAQSDIRGRAVVMYRERARGAEADRDWNLRSSRLAKKGRIEANARAERAERRIRDLTQEVRDERGAARDQMEQVRVRDERIKAVEDVLDQWQVDGYDALRRRIRRALEGGKP